MAAQRLTISALTQRNLSPRSLRNNLNVRHSLSPRTQNELSSPYECEAKTPCKCKVLPFNIDTPNRVKIINNALPNEGRSVLGCGGFGTVYEASYKGNQVAVKIIKRQRRSDVSVEAEKRAATLIHKNIIHIVGIEQGTAWSLITMELCSVSLEETLEEMTLDRKKRIDTWKAIASALEFCHNSGIIHADVKPKNVLIASDGEPKLADFGSSIMIDELDENLCSLHGTPGYVAPEIIKGNRPNKNSDIYSLGVLAWQLLARKAPFIGYHPHTILYLTGKGVRPDDNDINDECHGEYKILYQNLWSENVASRPPLNIIIDKLNNFS